MTKTFITEFLFQWSFGKSAVIPFCCKILTFWSQEMGVDEISGLFLLYVVILFQLYVPTYILYILHALFPARKVDTTECHTLHSKSINYISLCKYYLHFYLFSIYTLKRRNYDKSRISSLPFCIVTGRTGTAAQRMLCCFVSSPSVVT